MWSYYETTVDESTGPEQTESVLQSKHIYKVGGGGGPGALPGPRDKAAAIQGVRVPYILGAPHEAGYVSTQGVVYERMPLPSAVA